MHNASRSVTRRRESETGRSGQGSPGLASQAVLRQMSTNSAAFSTFRVLASASRNGSRQPPECRFGTGNSLRIGVQKWTMLARARGAEGVESGCPYHGSPGLASQAVLRLMPADSAAFSALRVCASAPRYGTRQPLKSGFDTGDSPRVVIQICTMPRDRSRGGGGRK